VTPAVLIRHSNNKQSRKRIDQILMVGRVESVIVNISNCSRMLRKDSRDSPWVVDYAPDPPTARIVEMRSVAFSTDADV